MKWNEDWFDLLVAASIEELHSSNYGIKGYRFSSQPIQSNLLFHFTIDFIIDLLLCYFLAGSSLSFPFGLGPAEMKRRERRGLVFSSRSGQAELWNCWMNNEAMEQFSARRGRSHNPPFIKSIPQLCCARCSIEFSPLTYRAALGSPLVLLLLPPPQLIHSIHYIHFMKQAAVGEEELRYLWIAFLLCCWLLFLSSLVFSLGGAIGGQPPITRAASKEGRQEKPPIAASSAGMKPLSLIWCCCSLSLAEPLAAASGHNPPKKSNNPNQIKLIHSLGQQSRNKPTFISSPIRKSELKWKFGFVDGVLLSPIKII